VNQVQSASRRVVRRRREQRFSAHRNAVVTRVRVSDNLARVIPSGQASPDEFIQAKFFLVHLLPRAIQWRPHRDAGYRTGRRHRRP